MTEHGPTPQPESDPNHLAAAGGEVERFVADALDLFVRAPISLALNAGRNLPGAVERGRQELRTARLVGHMAVEQTAPRVGAIGDELADSVRWALGQLGVLPAVDEPAAQQDPPERPSVDFKSPARLALVESKSTALEVTPDPDDELEKALDCLGPERTKPVVKPEAADLAIPGYDSLAASQVVPRLVALDPAELASVDAYERTHRGRRTILNRIRQLQS